MAKQLARSHSVTVLQLFPADTELEEPAATPFDRVISIPRRPGYPLQRSLRGLLGPLPIPVLNFYTPAANLVLSDLLRRGLVDAIQLEGVHLFRYLETIHEAPTRIPVLVDWHNIESELMTRYASNSTSLPKRLAAARVAKLLQRTELTMLSQEPIHTVVSEREKQALTARVPAADIHVVANGVDTHNFASVVPIEFKCDNPAAAMHLIFVGSMDYHANVDAVVWFVGSIWPELSQQFPYLHFSIVGRQPTAAVQALATDRIHVTGTVTDVREQYAKAFAVVVPLRVGGGTRLKIFEAMACGVPVISTSLGAEGIEARHKQNLLIADTPDDFRSAVDALVKQPHMRMELSRNARQFVVENYDWAAVGDRLTDIYRRLERTF